MSDAQGIDLFRLDGKSAIITGGSKGLGESMAAGLASAGADLLLTSRHGPEVEATAERLTREHGVKVIGSQSDVAKPVDVERVVERALKEFGKIDVLVNNAAINIRGAIEDLSLEQFEQVMAVNTFGPWTMCRTVAPHMKKANYGRVINISSTLGAVGLSERSPYASSKGALTIMTKALALEWAPYNITVNAICPGPFLTPMNEPIANLEWTQKNLIGAVALKRWGLMHEIQGAAIFLASDASSYVTGTSLFVDGGWTAH